MQILKTGYDPNLFFENLKRAKSRILFLDYDGTLAPFQIERDQAKPYPGVREALDTIMAADSSRVVLISGRRIDDLIPLLGLNKLPEIWGSHGWERLKPDGAYEAAELDESVARELIEAADWIKREGLDERSEQKPASVTLHWRGLDELGVESAKNKLSLTTL